MLLAAAQAASTPDSSTAALVARARERHRALDAAVSGYSALVRTRMDASLGRGAFARLTPLAVLEQEARLAWQAPNDLRIVLVGKRQRTAVPNAAINAVFTKPWFVPRALGDSIRLVDDDFPDRAAIHPLGAGAAAFYDFAITDSLELALPGRTVRAIGVEVTPRRADASLIAGTIWLDAETASVVRMTFAFVGQPWVEPEGSTRRDSLRAARENRGSMSVLRLTADLEYGLYDQQYWLPFRQSLTLSVRLPWISNILVPINFITTFRDVRVNQGGPIAFTGPPRDSDSGSAPDSGSSDVGATGRRDLRARRLGAYDAGQWEGGRYEIIAPPDSALRGYGGWNDSLTLDLSAADYERLTETGRDIAVLLERMPQNLTGVRRFGFAVDRVADIVRFNRGEGLSLGAGTTARLAPFITGIARARYAFSDGRVQGLLGVRRDGIRARSELTGFREMRDGDPMTQGLTVGNAFTSLLLSHDEGSYVFAEGGEIRHQRPIRRAADATLSLRLARESAPRATVGSGLFSRFQPNTPVVAGTFATALLEVKGGGGLASWVAGAEATGGDANAGRVWLGLTSRQEIGAGIDLTTNAWIGVGGGDALPQRQFRLGGTRSLRGYDAGTIRGSSAWSVGADVGMARRVISPVVFVDAGNAFGSSRSFTGDPLVSAGVGVSVFRGALRMHWATPLRGGTDWRFDLVLGSRR